MGRANNSFISYVGHAEETLSDVRVTLPEKDLWIAVLCRAVLDACKGPPDLDMTRRANKSHKSLYNYNRDQARHFFMEGGYHFNLICEMAGRNPSYVQAKVRKVILRKNGWNVDVPVYAHYRQGPKKGCKQGPKRGRRGSYEKRRVRGRPRLYVV